jgi:hypothetical protein
VRKAAYLFGLLVILLGAIHLFIWPLNKDLYQNHVEQRKQFPRSDVKWFSEKRINYEAQKTQNLQEYKWLDKRNGYVQIPIERAFDYYLRTHPQL